MPLRAPKYVPRALSAELSAEAPEYVPPLPAAAGTGRDWAPPDSAAAVTAPTWTETPGPKGANRPTWTKTTAAGTNKPIELDWKSLSLKVPTLLDIKNWTNRTPKQITAEANKRINTTREITSATNETFTCTPDKNGKFNAEAMTTPGMAPGAKQAYIKMAAIAAQIDDAKSLHHGHLTTYKSQLGSHVENIRTIVGKASTLKTDITDFAAKLAESVQPSAVANALHDARVRDTAAHKAKEILVKQLEKATAAEEAARTALASKSAEASVADKKLAEAVAEKEQVGMNLVLATVELEKLDSYKSYAAKLVGQLDEFQTQIGLTALTMNGLHDSYLVKALESAKKYAVSVAQAQAAKKEEGRL